MFLLNWVHSVTPPYYLLCGIGLKLFYLLRFICLCAMFSTAVVFSFSHMTSRSTLGSPVHMQLIKLPVTEEQIADGLLIFIFSNVYNLQTAQNICFSRVM